MGEGSYWYNTRRIGRRRLLRGTAAVGGLAAITSLLSCGSDGDSGPQDKSGLLHKPVDRSAQAVKGGVQQKVTGRNVLAFDAGNGIDSNEALHVYSRLLKQQVAKYPAPIASGVAADAAISWESQPDGLTHTYKLRPNVKFDPRPPTNGKLLTSADVKYSYEHFARTGQTRSVLVNSVNPEAPVVSATTPDASTFTIKTAFPYSPIHSMFAYFRFVGIIPTEAESTPEMRREPRGTGPWRLKENIDSARIVYDKNPDWYDAATVNLEGLHYTNIPEYANAIAQFRVGRVWTYDVRQDEVIETKQSIPSLLMIPQEEFPIAHYWVRFSYLPGSVFRDERVRKAMSNLIDRDLYIDTFGNVEKFEKAGLVVPSRWHTAVAAGEEGYWLDPKNEKDFGPNAKVFKYDPAEAKALLKAAGVGANREEKFTFTPGNNERIGAVLSGMWEQHGDFKFSANVVDQQNEFSPRYTNSMNKHEGIAFQAASAPPEIDVHLQQYYLSNQVRSGHLDGNGQPDTRLDEMVLKQRGETDPQRRIELIKEIQRYAAGKMYLLFEPGVALGYRLAHPWLGNFGVFRSRPGGSAVSEGDTHLWYDASKGGA